MFASGHRPDDALRATLLTLAPTLFAPVLTPDALVERGVPAVAIPAVASLAFAAPTLRDGPVARVIATLGLLLALGCWITAHLHQPGNGAVLMLGTTALIAGLWPATDGSVFRSLAPVPVSAATTAVLVLFGWPASLVGPFGEYGLVGSVAVTAAIAGRSASDRMDRQVASAAFLGPVAYALLRGGGVLPATALPLLLLTPAVLLLRSVPPERVWKPVLSAVLELFVSSPPRLLVSSFAALSAIGAVLLALPISDRSGRGLALVDALFTSVSAVCVTGLTTVDTGRLSGFGRLVLLLLLQLGGLGIMTFASAAAEWTGTRLGVRQEAVAARLLGQGARQNLRGALRRVLLITFLGEGVGALLLLPALLHHGGGLRAIPDSLFLAVSAFCNAGFTPWAGNLEPMVRDPFVILVIAALVVAGSLGPALLLALPDLLRGAKVAMWVRLSMLGNAVLVLVPFPLLLFLEWSRSLGNLPAQDRVAAAWLLTVSPRTAGFTAVDLSTIEPATWTLLVLLMFVGGNTGSTAGGIKVSTAAVLLASAWAAVRGRRSAEFGSRQIPHRVVYEAVAIVLAGGATVVAGLFLLQLTQPMPLDVSLFEVVSAVSTCGLTVGGTRLVDGLGKMVLIACMFAGRVGPLTLLLLLSADRDREGGATWPSEEVPVG